MRTYLSRLAMITLLVLGTGLVATPATAQEEVRPQAIHQASEMTYVPLPDDTLEDLMENYLANTGWENPDIDVDVSNGVVMLKGTVDTLAQKNSAKDLAYLLPHVHRVQNQLVVRPYRTSAMDLQEDVDQVLTDSKFYTVYDWVEPRVIDDEVTLTGFVYRPVHRHQIERQVSNVQGVKSVDNQILVVSSTPETENLRDRVADALYQSPYFDRHAMADDTGVHFVVRGSTVHLFGDVENQWERNLAERLVEQEISWIEVENNLEVMS